MKKLMFFALSVYLTFLTTATVMAGDFLRAIGFGGGNSGGNGGGNGAGGDVVGAPLDGGLLALLAAAGFTYFVARKKKKNKE